MSIFKTILLLCSVLLQPPCLRPPEAEDEAENNDSRLESPERLLLLAAMLYHPVIRQEVVQKFHLQASLSPHAHGEPTGRGWPPSMAQDAGDLRHYYHLKHYMFLPLLLLQAFTAGCILPQHVLLYLPGWLCLQVTCLLVRCSGRLVYWWPRVTY